MRRTVIIVAALTVSLPARGRDSIPQLLWVTL